MDKKLLHITNGDVLTEKIKELDLDGEFIVWREMLSSGPCVTDVGTQEFFKIRARFLEDNYGVSPKKYEEDFVQEIEKLTVVNDFDEIILWFEFDLFCHLNMMAAISFLIHNRKKGNIYLVCSSKLPGEEEMPNLSDISPKQLKQHYDYKIELDRDDLELAQHVWQLYCGDKPMRLNAELRKTSNFEYLSSCLKAHLERYPNVKNGLNTLESNILKLIKTHEIISEHHLLGYALQYQGYYGYIEPQMQKIIEKVRPFFTVKDGLLALTSNGENALEMTSNYYQLLKDEEVFGGTRKYNFLYDPETHNLLKL
ncbi:MAG TPA: DUF1835 domain-containing protein [Salinimicrobium sp.]|nr:DUF1835 domain-containing protein [Salinimicrobium sp.]